MIEFSRKALIIAGFEVHWYGLLIALGVLSAVLLAGRREKNLGLQKDTALNIALIAVPAALVCARLYYVIFSWENYANHPADILNLRQGGLAIYGGIIGGVLAGWIYCRAKKIPFSSGLDLAAPSLALGQAIGRWGNFINGEAYGRMVSDPRLQFFPFAVEIDGSWHLATFFYESAWCALIVIFILIAERKRFFHRRGDIFLCYIFLYGIERAFVEGLRTDSLYLGPVRVSQMISLLAALAVLLLLAGRRKGLVRWLPVFCLAALGVCLAMNQFVSAAAAVPVLLGSTAAIYIRNKA